MEEEGQIDFKIGFSSHPGAQVAKLDVRFQRPPPRCACASTCSQGACTPTPRTAVWRGRCRFIQTSV
ncbi:hypothetical protein Naga_101966g1 [Nannochloropsis gaditana]|uniref:Uncharacterized protein n=1 Tax=Nannochloropsis gaditana TaxID=72520 RepID=W7TCI1_9STRA|nr:hypothetical protein Naga_101966g1 [Nannochloropsis gaditana]